MFQYSQAKICAGGQNLSIPKRFILLVYERGKEKVLDN